MKEITLHIIVAIVVLLISLSVFRDSTFLLGITIAGAGGGLSFIIGRTSPRQYRQRAAAYSITVFIVSALIGALAIGASFFYYTLWVAVSGASYLVCYIAGSIGGKNKFGKDPTGDPV